MPFKVIQTTERGKICISAVPSGWEMNVLSWPPNSQLGMIRDEKSTPKSTWKHLPCIVKRHFSTYEEASDEANKRKSETDTDQEESRNTIQESCVFDDFNSMILAAQQNHQAEFPSPTNTTGIQVDKENVLPKLDELTPPGTSMIADVQVQEQQTLLWLNPPEKNNFQETVLKRPETIENGQMNIMMKLSDIGAQIEGFLRQAQQEKLSTVVGFEPIDSVEDLEQFNELLKDKESSDKLKEKLAVVCGTGKGRDVRKKWANLRTCFRRELNAQKNTKSGKAASKRRKYIYFEELLFLVPCMENRQTEGNLEEDDSQETNEGDVESNPSTSTPIRRQKKSTNVFQTDLDEALLKSLKSSETVDEDTNFALSLVPSLQNLTAEEKLDAKIGILNIFKQIRLARRVQTTSQTISRNYNVLQQPLSSFPVYNRGTNILPSQQPLQAYAVRSTPYPNSSLVQNIPSPGNSNDTAQSYFSNFSDDAQIYDL